MGFLSNNRWNLRHTLFSNVTELARSCGYDQNFGTSNGAKSAVAHVNWLLNKVDNYRLNFSCISMENEKTSIIVIDGLDLGSRQVGLTAHDRS